ncbi:anhydro-N-acetylmuramic acid kinase [unidentified eubacterium SCB49]|nr:anhydro-N-acetylmuramic acid kinase [unidentified eubacterium SCB49]
MKKENYKVLGVMSGTSLDGIDVAVCNFVPPESSKTARWEYGMGVTQTIPYSKEWKKKLKHAISLNKEALAVLDKEYTTYLGHCILSFITDNNVKNLDAVCSHGHTVLHQPNDGVTLQIGNLSIISEILKQTVVCDFRVQDVQMGGQGAPLVPIGDQLLFREYDYCLNLGGFANLSTQHYDKRVAYDICPVNIVLNHLCERIGLAYDDKGAIAREGFVLDRLLKKLNRLEFYHQKPPKSLGLEWVKEQVMPLIESSGLDERGAIATFTVHAAKQIAAQVKPNSSLLITGGGAYNTYLIEKITEFAQVTVHIPEAKLLEFKEALIFGFLGVRKLREEINCLSSVTGATIDHSSGVVFKYNEL